jgi:hypothetical protein
VNLLQTLMDWSSARTPRHDCGRIPNTTTIKVQLYFMLALDGVQHGVPPIMLFLKPHRKSYHRLISHVLLKAFVQCIMIGD